LTAIRSLSLNIISAGFARFWQAALQLLLTPVIVHLLGPVAYGLVGFYAALTLFLAFLDQAVSPVLMRELGRSASRPDAAEQLRSLLRTSALFSMGTAAGLGLLIVLGAPLIPRNWLLNSGLSDSKLINSIRLMGLSLACQWPWFMVGTIYAAVWALVPTDIPRLTGVALSMMVALVTWGALLAILPTVRADAFGFMRLLKLQGFRAS